MMDERGKQVLSFVTRVVTRLALGPATFGIGIERPDGNVLLDEFITRCQAMDYPRVLELGTKRSKPERSTKHDEWIPNAGEYLGIDIEEGVDVDIVADVHCLSETVGEEQFDVIISCSTFEHFKYPHLAAHEIMKVLKINGVLLIQTHQTFIPHAFPYDYFRFSREALAGLFGESMGFRVIATDYEFPARIFAPSLPAVRRGKGFLNVRLFGEKIGKTPQNFIYEFDGKKKDEEKAQGNRT